MKAFENGKTTSIVKSCSLMVRRYFSSRENKSTKSQIPCFLLANKIDMLEESEIDAKKAQLDDFVAEKEFAGWFPTSAKENKNIDRAASELIR